MENKRTCLYDKHVALGALISPFGGFDMPIQYSSIIDEHNAVREHCGVFDVSHMGEVRIKGRDAERYVNHLFTNDITGASDGKLFYAANIDKDVAWMQAHLDGYDLTFDHCSDYYGQIAVQGPEAEAVMEEVLGITCSELTFYTVKTIEADGETVIVSRTGYTGEDGFEIYGSHDFIRRQWDLLMESGRCKPCGLGCRDTLRFEVGLPLYGDELSEDISPVMAGLSMFCKLDKPEFIGREALLRQKTEGVARRLVGIELQDRAIPRHGYAVLSDGVKVGEVTTGYNSISTGKSVCMALVDTTHAKLGTPLEIQIRKKTFPGTVVKKRFYDKHYKK